MMMMGLKDDEEGDSKSKGSSQLGLDQNLRDLIESSRTGDLPALCKLLQDGVDPNGCDNKNQTALHHACSRGHLDCVETLLKSACIQIDPISNTGITPLVAASVKGHHEVVGLLLCDGRADPNSVGFRGRGALHGAARHGHAAATTVLLGCERVDANIIDLEGRTPLVDASRRGHKNIVRQFLASQSLDRSTLGAAHDAALAAVQEDVAKILQETSHDHS
mmetsp:Transcript_31522/g.51413  ORF Transcript_31522/g.51413 Transcript_31522/m.51413 type:complete len:220 (+) Transcript_31522:3-662(+)